MTGILPTKNSVRITESDGSFGTLPAASESAAGCMTADHAKQLAALWQVHQTAGGTVVIERPAPVNTAGLVTREQLKAVLSAIPAPTDPMRLLAPLHSEIDALRQQMAALPAPGQSDGQLRTILSEVIAQAERMDARLSAVESVIEVLRQIAAVKASMQEAA